MHTSQHGNIYSLPGSQPKFTYNNIAWFTLLLTAVLVVPACAIVITLMINATGINEYIIFISACWLCVFLGLKLVRMQHIAPFMFEKVTVSDGLKQRCIKKISIIQAETDKWKSNYEKCESVFMNLSRQPAWSYLDEVISILGRIKHSAQTDGNIRFEEIVALYNWVEGSKPVVLKGYLNTLEASYEYAKAEYAQQGKNIDELFPELSRGSIAVFGKVPSYATIFWHDLYHDIKQEHPILAESELLKPKLTKAA